MRRCNYNINTACIQQVVILICYTRMPTVHELDLHQKSAPHKRSMTCMIGVIKKKNLANSGPTPA